MSNGSPGGALPVAAEAATVCRRARPAPWGAPGHADPPIRARPRWRRICWKTATTFARSRSCSAIRTSARRWSMIYTHMLNRGGGGGERMGAVRCDRPQERLGSGGHVLVEHNVSA